MITVQLKGGIGNQLYQIAAIYSHAKEHNLKFVLNYELEFGAMQGLHPKTYKNRLKKILTSHVESRHLNILLFLFLVLNTMLYTMDTIKVGNIFNLYLEMI